jgi:CheY-like chemotaxis protein
MILVVEDTDAVSTPLMDRLEAMFIDKISVLTKNVNSAITKFDACPNVFDGVILDMGMPLTNDMSTYDDFGGLRVYEHIRKNFPKLPIIIFSSCDKNVLQKKLEKLYFPDLYTEISEKNVKSVCIAFKNQIFESYGVVI